MVTEESLRIQREQYKLSAQFNEIYDKNIGEEVLMENYFDKLS